VVLQIKLPPQGQRASQSWVHQVGGQVVGQGMGHVTTVAPQVTCPGSPGQEPFTAVQLGAVQVTVPPFQQFAVHVAFGAMGRLAAGSGAGAPAREARKA
jgi:hypothetical protein